MGSAARLFVFALLFGLLGLFISPAQALHTKPEQIRAMNTILDEIKDHYGMAKFKKETYGVSVSELRKKYGDMIRAAMTIEEAYGWVPQEERKVLPADEFRQLMIAMVAEFRDGHTNLGRLVHNAASVGLLTAAIDGQLFVAGVHPELFHRDSSMKDVQVGDKILLVNGTPVQELAYQFLPYMQTGTYENRFNMALESVLERQYSILRRVPEGERVEILFYRPGEGEYLAKLPWVEFEDYIKERARHPYRFPQPFESLVREKDMVYGMGGLVKSYFKYGLEHTVQPGQIVNLGELYNLELMQKAQAQGRPQTPSMSWSSSLGPSGSPVHMGEPLVRPVTRLPVYTIRHHGMTVGVLRLPSYSSPNSDYANELAWLQEMINRLELNTDVLIVDQLSNTGGAVMMVTELLSMLSPEPLQTVAADWRLSETLLSSNKQSARMASGPKGGNYADYRINELLLKDMEMKMRAGEKWSGFQPSFGDFEEKGEGFGTVYPSKEGVYTKPILVLNDNRSASGGDFLPRILQANGRAVIIGEISAGLGGPVYRKTDSLPGSQMSFRCTSAFCVTADGQPIENIGTVPNIFREINSRDLGDNFRLYSQQMLHVAVSLAAAHLNGQEITEVVQRNNEAMDKFRVAGAGSEVQARLKPYREKIESRLTSQPAFLKRDWAALAGIYKELFAELRQMSVQEETLLQGEDWAHLVIPLPPALRAMDSILSVSWRKGETVQRLSEMAKLPQYRKDKSLLILIQTIEEESLNLMEEFRHADVPTCAALLSTQ